MPDKKINLEHGERVSIELPVEHERSAERKQPERSRAVVPPPAQDEDLYAFRKETEISFHDLGTRLRSVPTLAGDAPLEQRYRAITETASPVRHDGWMNEYVEQEFELNLNRSIILPGDPGEQVSGDPNWIRIASDPITEAMERQIEATLLGNRVTGSADAFDPFGMSAANNTGRKISNCWQLPFEASELWIDAYYFDDKQTLYIPLTPPARRTSVENITYLPAGISTPELEDIVAVFGDDELAESRPVVGSSSSKWKERTARPEDEQESWNPINLAEMGVQKEGSIRKLEIRGKGYFKIRTAAFYEEFDMSANKITEQRYDDDGQPLTPSPDDPPAEKPWISKGDKVRFYLRPKTVVFLANIKTIYALWQSRFVTHEGHTFALEAWKARATSAVTAAFAGRLSIYPRWIGKRLRDEAGQIIRSIDYPRWWRGPEIGFGLPEVNTVRTVLGDFGSIAALDLSSLGQPELPIYHYIDRNPKISSGLVWPYYESHDYDFSNDYFRGSAGAASPDPLADILINPPYQLATPPPVKYYYENIYEPSLQLEDGYQSDGTRLERHIITSEYFPYRRFLVGAYVKNGKVFYMWNHLLSPPFPLVDTKANSVVARIDTRQIRAATFYRPKPYNSE